MSETTPEIKPAEFAILDADEVTKTLAGLDESTAVAIKSSYGAFLAKADEWMKTADSIVITDASQLREMKLARETRLGLREIRCAVDKNRKLLKEKSFREGKAIDGMANLIEAVIAPIEAALLEKEKFAERKEAERIESVRVERQAKLAVYSSVVHPDLGTMPQASFDSILSDAALLAEAKAAAAKKAAEELIAKEKADAEERARIEAENAKLKAEAAAAAEAARAEREKLLAEQRAKDESARAELEAVEAKARAEREAAQKEREAAEAKAKADAEVAAAAVAKAEAEAKRLRDEQAAKLKAEAAAKKAAAAAPDRDKLIALAAKIRALEIPEFTTDEAKAVRGEIIGANERYAKWAEKLAANLMTEGKQS